MSNWRITGSAILGLMLASCSTTGANTETAAVSAQPSAITLVSVVAASELLAERKDLILLDVRTPQEFATGYIDGAKNIDFLNSAFVDSISKLDKSKHYVVYCGSGRRSGKATAQMESLGFSNITDVDGGITAWQEADLPLEGK